MISKRKHEELLFFGKNKIHVRWIFYWSFLDFIWKIRKHNGIKTALEVTINTNNVYLVTSVLVLKNEW